MKKILFLSFMISFLSGIGQITDCDNSCCRVSCVNCALTTLGSDYSDFGWHLEFADDFSGNTLDTSKWTILEGVVRDFSWENEKEWLDPKCIKVTDGTLQILAKDEPCTGCSYMDYSANAMRTDNFDIRTGEIWTKKKFLYGKYEIRFKIPGQDCLWPAFWLYDNDFREAELDFFELDGGKVHYFSCNVHKNNDLLGPSQDCMFEHHYFQSDFTEWHTLVCYFLFDKIVWELDGEIIRELLRNDQLSDCDIGLNSTAMWLSAYPDLAMHLVLNLAVFADKSGDEIEGEAKYVIDYVRYSSFINQSNSIGDDSNGICSSNLYISNPSGIIPQDFQTSQTLTIDSISLAADQTLNLYSNLIVIGNKSEINFDSNFTALLDSCRQERLNSEIIVIEEPNLDLWMLKICEVPVLSLEIYNVNKYSIFVYDQSEQIVANSGSIISNHADLYDFSNFREGIYLVELILSNNITSRKFQFQIIVDDCVKSLQNTIQFGRYISELDLGGNTSIELPDADLVVLKHKVVITSNSKSQLNLKLYIYNMSGHMLSERFIEKLDSFDVREIDCAELLSGSYIFILKDMDSNILSINKNLIYD